VAKTTEWNLIAATDAATDAATEMDPETEMGRFSSHLKQCRVNPFATTAAASGMRVWNPIAAMVTAVRSVEIVRHLS
jgi:hypothetical protein